MTWYTHLSPKRVLCHHERWWDGEGYPTGLQHQAIPLFARIILVADAFDVMTSRRAYRSQMTVSQAGEELILASGRQFDPSIVDVFAYVDRQLLEVQANPTTPDPRLYAN